MNFIRRLVNIWITKQAWKCWIVLTNWFWLFLNLFLIIFGLLR